MSDANTPYQQNAPTFLTKPNVKIGDKVKIYYGDDLLDAAAVTEF